MFTLCSQHVSKGLGRLIHYRPVLSIKPDIAKLMATTGKHYPLALLYQNTTRRYSKRSKPDGKGNALPTAHNKSHAHSGIHRPPHQIPHIHLVPNPHDLLISDVEHETLETTIATKLGITYLSKVPKDIQRKVIREAYGYYCGPDDRAIVPLSVISKSKALWVFFVVDSGSPNTYLSPQACAALGLREDLPSWHILIGGHKAKVSLIPPGPQFKGINILGTDFCVDHQVVKASDYLRGEVKLGFGGKWEAVEERR